MFTHVIGKAPASSLALVPGVLRPPCHSERLCVGHETRRDSSRVVLYRNDNDSSQITSARL